MAFAVLHETEEGISLLEESGRRYFEYFSDAQTLYYEMSSCIGPDEKLYIIEIIIGL